MLARSFAIVGAGFSGAVVARQLAEAGHSATVFDTRDHVAGNCHTERHETGVMVHTYGPHIFHTQHEHVWEFINRFGVMMPYRHRVRAMVGDKAFQMPMNLTLINEFLAPIFRQPKSKHLLPQKQTQQLQTQFRLKIKGCDSWVANCTTLFCGLHQKAVGCRSNRVARKYPGTTTASVYR